MTAGVEQQGEGPPGGPWTSPDGTADTPEWKPAMPIWRFWLLMVITLGIYRLFWIAGVARELRRNQDSDIRPWHYVLGLLVGVASPFVAATVTGHIDRNGIRRGLDTGPSKGLIVTLSVVAMVAEFASSNVTDAMIASGASLWLTVLILVCTYAAVVPLPWALIQLRLNRLKSAMAYPERPSRLSRFSLPQFGVIALGVVFWPLVIIGSLPDSTLDTLFAPEAVGEPVLADEPISGSAGGYWITVRTDNWLRVDADANPDEPDLELVTQTQHSWLVVYALRGDWTLDDIVNFRRNEIGRDIPNLTTREQRTLLGDSAVPVSYARYYGKFDPRDTFPTTWWVSTVVTDSGAVEVVASTGNGHMAAKELEGIVKSLRIESRMRQP